MGFAEGTGLFWLAGMANGVRFFAPPYWKMYGSLDGPVVASVFDLKHLPISYLSYARVLYLPVFVLCALIVFGNQWVLRPEKSLDTSAEFVRGKLRELGSFKRDEAITALIVLCSIVFWSTDRWHHLPSFFIGMVGLAVFALAGIVGNADIAGGISWTLLLFMGGTRAAPTHADHPAFWLYSSGSTGRPKGAVHSHANLVLDRGTLRQSHPRPDRGRCLLLRRETFLRIWPGQRPDLPAQRRRDDAADGRTRDPRGDLPPLDRRYRRHAANGVLRRPDRFRRHAGLAVAAQPRRCRRCAWVSSAGEALPAEIGERFVRHFGVDIVDGIGSTEMLHIFMSNRPARCATAPPAGRCPATKSNCAARMAMPCRTANPATCISTARPPR